MVAIETGNQTKSSLQKVAMKEGLSLVAKFCLILELIKLFAVDSENQQENQDMDKVPEVLHYLGRATSLVEGLRGEESNFLHQLDERKKTIEKLREEVAELMGKNQETIDEKNSLSITLRKSEQEQLTLAKTLQVANEKLNNSTSKLDELKQENNRLKRDVDLKEQEKDLKDDEINDLRRKHEMATSELEICRKDLADCQSKLGAEEKGKEKLSDELVSLKETLKEVERSRTDLKKEIKNLKAAKSSVENELSEKKSELEELNQLLERKSEREIQKESEASEAQSKFIEIEANRHKVKKENVSLKLRIEELEHLLKLERNTCEKQAEEIKRLDDLKTNLEERLKKISDEILSHSKNVQDYESKLRNAESTSAKFSNEKKEIEEHLIKLNSVLRSCLKLGNVTLNDSDITFDEIVPSKNRKSNLLSTLLDTELLDAEFVRSAIIDLLARVDTLSKERDDLLTGLESADKSSNTLKENNRNLKLKIERLENDLNKYEKENMMMAHKLDESSANSQKLDDVIEKLNNEKKALAMRIENLESQVNKVEKEKRRLINDLNSVKTVKLMSEKEYVETKERLENKIKKLEATKDSSDSRIHTLMKNLNQLTEEKESLLQELKMVNDKLIELQNCNYKLHSALNESNMALKRCSDGERDLKKRMSSLTDSVEQRDSASKDQHKQLRKLKDQIEELRTEKSSLKTAIETDRSSLIHNKENMHTLQMRIKQLESELNLSNLKRKEAEYQQTLLTNGNIDKEGKIKELRAEMATLEERTKQLLLSQKTMEKTTYSVSSINRRNANKIEEMKITEKSFVDDTNMTAKGLLALEEKNMEFQRKVKSLQNLMDEATGGSGHTLLEDISKLKEAQRHAEELLQSSENLLRHSPKPANNSNGGVTLSVDRTTEMSNQDMTQTPSRFKPVPMKGDWHRERPVVTSTPIQREQSATNGHRPSSSKGKDNP